MSVLLWLSLAHALTLQEVADLELSRAAPEALAEGLASDDVAVRAATARALGRLRSEDTLVLLAKAKGDKAPAVQLQAAAALAWTPGSAPSARAWLAALPPLVPGPAAVRRDDLRPVLLRALGKQGDAADIPALTAALGCSSRLSTAAADALADLARRDVGEVRLAVPALVATLGRLDATLVEAAAHALFRIEPGQPWGPLLAASIPRLPSGPARAWVLRAAQTGLSDSERLPYLLDALTDSDGRMVAAGWDGIGALAKAPAGLDRLPASSDPQARLARARALAPPVPAQAPGEIVDKALAATTARERTDLVGPLFGTKLDPALALRLLTSEDPALREAAVGLLAEGEQAEAGVAPLLTHFAGEESVHVQAAILDFFVALDASARPSPELLSGLVTAAAKSDNTRVLRAAAALARTASLVVSVPEAPAPVVDLAAASRITGARVYTTAGEVLLSLRPDVAPLTVLRFAAHVEADDYDGTPFHRVVPGFVAQGGDPRGDGWGSPDEALPDEVSHIRYEAGAVGLARGPRDTGGSQFFFSLGPTPHLTGDYTWFGQVVQGFGTVRALTPDDLVLDIIIERAAE